MWIVRIALDKPYTFIVMALLILFSAPLAIMRTPLGQKFFVEDAKIWNRLLGEHFAAEQQQGVMPRYVIESFQEAGIEVPKQ